MFDNLNTLVNAGLLLGSSALVGSIVASMTLPALFVAFVLFVLALGWMLS